MQKVQGREDVGHFVLMGVKGVDAGKRKKIQDEQTKGGQE